MEDGKRASLDRGGSAEWLGLDMVHLMLCMLDEERDDTMSFWSAVLPNVKQVHAVKKPKLCLPHTKDQPRHVRKSGEPAVLGFQHQDLGQPLVWQKGITGDSSSTRLFLV